MPRNVEIKARVWDADAMQRRIEEAAGTKGQLMEQEDVFFPCPNGRLKLRVFPAGRGELIHYERADTSEARPSEYRLAPVAAPSPLRAVLEAAYGRGVIVRKRRWLYWAGQTRMHLDTVEGLGDFVELEVTLTDTQTETDGVVIAEAFAQLLGIQPGDRVPQAYADLLESGGEEQA
ncbi:MAG: class IV adenylate cyclase [Candidatus Hydrogenedentota bacterium]